MNHVLCEHCGGFLINTELGMVCTVCMRSPKDTEEYEDEDPLDRVLRSMGEVP